MSSTCNVRVVNVKILASCNSRSRATFEELRKAEFLIYLKIPFNVVKLFLKTVTTTVAVSV